MFGDEAIRVGGNGLLALDAVHWLMGDEAFSGQTSTEADVKITHTRKQDVAWFYATVFLVPAAVIGAGVMVTRGKRRPSRRARAARLLRRPRPGLEVPRDRPRRRRAGWLGHAGPAGRVPDLAARARARARGRDRDRREQVGRHADPLRRRLQRRRSDPPGQGRLAAPGREEGGGAETRPARQARRQAGDAASAPSPARSARR